MMRRPMWPILLTYRYHDMRHISFSQTDGGQRDPRELGRHRVISLYDEFISLHTDTNKWDLVKTNTVKVKILVWSVRLFQYLMNLDL